MSARGWEALEKVLMVGAIAAVLVLLWSAWLVGMGTP